MTFVDLRTHQKWFFCLTFRWDLCPLSAFLIQIGWSQWPDTTLTSHIYFPNIYVRLIAPFPEMTEKGKAAFTEHLWCAGTTPGAALHNTSSHGDLTTTWWSGRCWRSPRDAERLCRLAKVTQLVQVVGTEIRSQVSFDFRNSFVTLGCLQYTSNSHLCLHSPVHFIKTFRVLEMRQREAALRILCVRHPASPD